MACTLGVNQSVPKLTLAEIERAVACVHAEGRCGKCSDILAGVALLLLAPPRAKQCEVCGYVVWNVAQPEKIAGNVCKQIGHRNEDGTWALCGGRLLPLVFGLSEEG